MPESTELAFGVVEAYYGRSWSAEQRQACLAAYPSLGIGNYLYAPKSDSHLRRDWREPWPEDQLAELAGTLGLASDSGLMAGVGLSPLGLAGLDAPRERDALNAKLQQIEQLEPRLLGIFFDDMPSAGASMASQQLAIIDFVAERTSAQKIIVCPSYYTTDKLLERLFGEMPANYWRDLGCGMDSRLEFFWTGERVCSESYCRDNLDFIAEQFQRLPALWDNYPVNDGEKSSRFLNLLPFRREAWLAEMTSYHFANPMNQPRLSLLPLATLAVGGEPTASQQQWRSAIEQFCPELAGEIENDAQCFQQQGLDGLADVALRELQHRYAQHASEGSMLAGEIRDWLCGEYAFDPACLTG